MLLKVEFQPGLVKDHTELEAEGAWVDGQWVRFQRGKPQAMGGYELAEDATFTGMARAAHAWVTLSGHRGYAWATPSNVYYTINSTRINITPPHSEGVLTNPFSTTNGSTTVTVTHADHRLEADMTVTFSNQHASVGGLTLSGAYTVVSVTDTDTYTITAASAATSTASAGGGNVDYSVTFKAGRTDAATGSGYGTSTYSTGTYGTSANAAFELGTWTLDNFGENLLAVPRGGGLYEFQPEVAYNQLVTTGDFSSSTGWATGTGWSIGSGVATKTAGSASNLSQAMSTVLEGGRTYRVTFTVTRTAGSVAFKVNTGSGIVSVGDASAAISIGGTYSRIFRCPASPTDILFEADASFAGTIDDVSIKLENKLYRIDEAPLQNNAMFVDPNGIVVLVGTEDTTGVYDNLLIRWCDQENNRTWVPDASNLAGDYKMWSGGRGIGGIASRQQNFVWTDNSLYSMQFTGDNATVFSCRLLGTGCGLIGWNAAAEHNGIVYWLAPSGNFFGCSGAVPEQLQCPIRRDVTENIATSQGGKTFAFVNSAFSEIWWLYPDGRDDSGSNKECSRYAVFNLAENHWTSGTLARSAAIPQGVFEYPILLGTDGYVYYHEKGNDANGSVLTSSLTSSYFDIEDGNNLIQINRIVPDFEDQQGGVTFTLYTRMWPNGTEYTTSAGTAGTSTLKLDVRATGRQAKIKLAASASPSKWRLGTLRLDSRQTGQTR